MLSKIWSHMHVLNILLVLCMQHTQCKDSDSACICALMWTKHCQREPWLRSLNAANRFDSHLSAHTCHLYIFRLVYVIDHVWMPLFFCVCVMQCNVQNYQSARLPTEQPKKWKMRVWEVFVFYEVNLRKFIGLSANQKGSANRIIHYDWSTQGVECRLFFLS